MKNNKQQKEIKTNALPLGWQLNYSKNKTIGFSPASRKSPKKNKKIIEYKGDGHLVTFGPTGSGKSRGSAIPALLSHQGAAIVVDVKGELYNTTARHRRDMGQKVYKIDPWKLIDSKTDTLNPLDILKLPGGDLEEEANVLAQLLAGQSGKNHRDMFWENTSQALNAGLISYLGTSVEKKHCRLSYVREMLIDDFPYTLAKLLDEKKIKSRLAQEEFSIFLNHPERETRPSVLSTAQQHFRLLGTDAIKRSMDSSSISLQDIIDNKAMTIYLIIPPHKLESHSNILRIWLGIMLQVISRRQSMPRDKTLFLVDEASSLGSMEPLKRAITLLRGYGVQIWTFWQDVSQIHNLYPQDWQTIINNAGVLQLLGPRNYRMAEEYAALIGGIHADQLFSMKESDQALLTDINRHPQIYQRLDYLKDRRFIGLYDKNPLFEVSLTSARAKINTADQAKI